MYPLKQDEGTNDLEHCIPFNSKYPKNFSGKITAIARLVKEILKPVILIVIAPIISMGLSVLLVLSLIEIAIYGVIQGIKKLNQGRDHSTA